MKLNNKVRLAMFIAIPVLIISTVLIIMFVTSSNKKPSEEIVSIDTPEINYEPEEENEDEINVEMGLSLFDIKPLSADTAGVKTDSDFKLVCKEGQDITIIEKALRVTPSDPFILKKISNEEYLIDFKEDLKMDTVYSFALHNEQDEKMSSWAFQTEKDFKVVSTLPRDGSKYVPVNTGIEVIFNLNNYENLDDYFTIEPSVKGEFVYNNKTAVFMPERLDYGTVYKITIKAGLGIIDSDKTLKEDITFTFQTHDSDEDMRRKAFSIYESMYSVTTEMQPVLELYTDDYFYDKELTIDIYRYDSADLFIDAVEQSNDNEHFFNRKPVLYENLTQVTSMKGSMVNSEDYYSWRKYLLLPDDIPQGYYLVNISYEDYMSQTFLQISDLLTYAMISDTDTLVWVNNGITGLPETNAKVEVNNKEYKTNSDGIAVIDKSHNEKLKENGNDYVKITSNHGEHVASLLHNRYYYYSNNPEYWYYMYTDRGLYLPTDEINLWGYIRSKENEKIENLMVHFYKEGATDYEIDAKEIKLTQAGTYSSHFKFESLPRGYYTLAIKQGDNILSTRSIYISKYEKPIYKLNGTFDEEAVFSWDTVTFDVQANFFEGSPAAGLQLDYYYNTYNYEYKTVEGSFQCDSNGSTKLEFQPSVIKNDWRPYYVSFRAFTSKAEEVEVRCSDGITVFPKDTMILTEFVNEDEEEYVDVEVNRIDLSGYDSWSYDYENIKGEPVNTELDIEINEINYVKVVEGQKYDFINKVTYDIYHYDKKIYNVFNEKVETMDGNAKLYYPFEDNKDYEIIIILKDSRGNKIVEEATYYRFQRERRYSSIKNYRLKVDQDNYKLNDNVQVDLICDEETIVDNSQDKVLYMKLKNGIIDYTVSDETKHQFTFTENYIPNLYIKAVYFDGDKIFSTYSSWVTYDYKERELQINVETDKDSYQPGEIVNLDIDVKDNEGKPCGADVSVSVVDEAFFAVYNSEASPLASIYKYNCGAGIYSEYISYKQVDISGGGGAEEGGEGDDDSIRSDFKDTAIFKAIKTDENGKGNISFKLPDNLTSWRITYQGITSDMQAGDGKININTKLPFFINTIFKDTFIEGDSPYLSVRTYGEEINGQEKIHYTVFIEDDKGQTRTFEVEGKSHDYTNIPLGQMELGDYTITVKGQYEDYKDGIKRSFSVVPSMIQFDHDIYYKVTDELKLKPTDSFSDLTFYNEDNALMYHSLISLYHSFGKRVDQILAKEISGQLLHEYFNFEYNEEEQDIERYQLYSGGIALLPYSEEEVQLSAKICALTNDSFDVPALNRFFYRVIEKEDYTDEEKLAAYYGLATFREPVLLDLYWLNENRNELGTMSKLYLALAFEQLGEYSAAKAIYQQVMAGNGQELDKYIYINSSSSEDENIQATALMALLGIKLHQTEAIRLFGYINDYRSNTVLVNIEKLLYLMNIKIVDSNSSFTYELGGKKETVNLPKNEIYHLTLFNSELQDIKFSDINGNIVVHQNVTGGVEDLPDNSNNGFSLTRSYTNKNKGSSSYEYKQSDLIQVQLNPKFSEKMPSGWYEITDFLPAGLTYVGAGGQGDYPAIREGQKLMFYYFYNKDKPIEPIIYYARAILPGEFHVDYALMKYYKETNIAYTNTATIKILDE